MLTLDKRRDLITVIKPIFLPIGFRLLEFIYKRSRPHFLWVNWRNNTVEMLGEHTKRL